MHIIYRICNLCDSCFYDSNKVLKQLMDYSILILIDEDDKLYFNYRDNDLETVDFSKLCLTCHKAIFRYFNPERR
jgi:hypothetical protein